MAYTVTVIGKARKQLSEIDEPQRTRIGHALVGLAENPRSSQVKKLKGRENEYRLRVGNYRAVFTIDDGGKAVVVLEIFPRGDGYD